MRSRLLNAHWLNERNLFLLVCLLCGLPVWLAHFPPMVDLPQHAAQVALFLNLNDPAFPFAEQFQLNLFTPGLLGYFLVGIFTPLLGIVLACKLVVWLALATFALSTRFLLKQTGADTYWAWLTFPVMYGFAFQWGFLNFLITVPLGILFLALVWRQVESCNWRSSLMVVLVLNWLFYCHALVMALFVLVALVYWLFSSRNFRDFIKYAWPLATLAPIVIAWFIITSKHSLSSSPVEWDLSWLNTADGYYAYIASWADRADPGWGRITGFIPRMLGERPGLLVTALGILLFALPFIAGGRIAKSRVRLIPLISVTLVILFLPSVLFGNVFTVQRFALLAMPLFLVMIDAGGNPTPMQRNLRWLAPLIAVGWITHMSINALQFNKDAEGFQTVLSKMQPHKQAISLIFARDDTHSISPTFIHFPAWYSAINAGVTNPSFAETYMQPVIYRPEYVSKARFQGFAWNPGWFNWQKHEGYLYDYFVVRAKEDVSSFIFRTAQCRIRLVTHSGLWWLYERDPACRKSS